MLFIVVMHLASYLFEIASLQACLGNRENKYFKWTLRSQDDQEQIQLVAGWSAWTCDPWITEQVP